MSNVNVLVLQTGPSRQQHFAAGRLETEKTTNPVTLTVKDEHGQSLMRTFNVTHQFFPHQRECAGEMEDSKEVLQLANDPDNHGSKLFQSYNTFFSIGSTSTQGWIRGADNELHAIIPAANDKSGMFELCGNGTLGTIKKNKDNHFNQIEYEVDKYSKQIIAYLKDWFGGGGAKVLCFNSIGYHPELEDKIVDVNNLEKVEMVAATRARVHGALQQQQQLYGNAGIDLKDKSYSPIIDVLKRVSSDNVCKGEGAGIFIIPRKMVVRNSDGVIGDGSNPEFKVGIKKIGGSWVNHMIKNAQLFNLEGYQYIVDSGGGSATAYDTKTKLNYTSMTGQGKKDKWKYKAK